MSAPARTSPGVVAEDGSNRFESIVFPGSKNVVDVEIRNGTVYAIKPTTADPEWLCLPPLADLHVHANRAFTPPSSRPRGLDDAVQKVAGVFSEFSADDYERHASKLVKAAYRHATTKLRTHADIDSLTGLNAVEGSLRAAEVNRGIVDLDVVAFASAGADPATPEGSAMLCDAVELGAAFLGAAPAFCPDQQASIDAILDLAADRGMPVDLHLDEHLDAERCASGYLAAATIDRGLEGKVTLGHGCAISALPVRERRRVIESLAAARITVIVLPRTNLYLQDAAGSLPIRRGVAPVKEMVNAGVAVRFASDNVRDAFYPYGDADLLGVAMDGVLACQFDDPRQVVAAICDGRESLAEGDPADLVLLPGTDVDSVLADPPSQRWIIRAGKAVRL